MFSFLLTNCIHEIEWNGNHAMNRVPGLAFAFLFLSGYQPSIAHDIYEGLKEDGSIQSGNSAQVCCSGDPVTGDCEAISEVRVNPDGSAVLYSNRYRRRVIVASEKVTWMAVKGGEESPAHLCGVLRFTMSSEKPTNALQIDPDVFVYCAFVKPGGV
jgi:hypothetical protein